MLERLRWLFQRRYREREMARELQSHLEAEIDEQLAAGASPEAAQSAAHHAMGNTALVMEEARALWSWLVVERLAQDVRYALRLMRRSPGFSAVVILTLGLGISMNTTMFSVINAMLFQPMHARHPEEIVAVFSSTSSENSYGSSSYLDYNDVRERSGDVIRDLAAFTLSPADLNFGESIRHLTVGTVTGNYFHMLGADFVHGRNFLPEEDRLLDPRTVVILNETMWRSHFNGDPAVIGKTVRINEQSFTVIGVVDHKFSRLRQFFDVDAFIPAAATDRTFGRQALNSRRARQFYMLGRLQPGVLIGQAQARLRLAAENLHAEQPGIWSNDKGRAATISVVSEQDSRVPPQARSNVFMFSAFLLAVVGMVLLISCTNLASLALSRALGRQKEIAVRRAIGASRWRVLRQLLVESMLLALAGAIAALLLTRWLTQLLTAYRPPMEVAFGLDVGIDYRVLLFALLMTLITTILFGLAPALHATGSDVVSALKESTASIRAARFSFRNALTVGEVAMCIILLMPTGLFLRSLQNFQNVDLGFRRDHLALVSVTLEPKQYSPTRGILAYHELIDRLSRVEGVASADMAMVVPLSGMRNTLSFMEAGSAEPARTVDANVVGPRYFETMGIPLVRGHGFEALAQNRDVVVINEEFARTFWPNEDPIGKRLVNPKMPAKPIEVIGVVGTGKYNSVAEDPTPYAYRPMDQEYSPSAIFHIRTRTSPATLVTRLTKEIQAYDPNMSVFEPRTMDDQLAISVGPYEALAITLGIFGGFAVVLAFAGLYGLIAYQTTRRTREIGIRIALGARSGNILMLMAKQGLALTLIGLLIGIPASLGIGLLISNFLFGVAPIDPLTLLAVPGFVAIVASAAIGIPAARSVRVEPSAALRD